MSYRNLYTDVWDFHKSFQEVKDTDEYWQAVIDESDRSQKSTINTNLQMIYCLQLFQNLSAVIRR